VSYNIIKEKEKTDEEIADMKHPFEDDLLERKEIAETIANIISNTKSSYVYNINSPYGTGKTFFLKRLKCLLENKDCKVILYNSWENDLVEDPFIPLIQEIINALNYKKLTWLENSEKFIKAFGEAAAEVISSHNIIMKIAYKTYENFNDDLKDNVKKETDTLLQQYKQIKDLISRFKKSLAEIINPEKPIIIIIDELDRCRPDYTVKTLETIKHFFDIDNVIFVLAMDREQIKSTVGVLYGVNIEKNSSEYLRKFIDQDFYLPKPNSEKYLKFLCEKYLKEIVRPFCNNTDMYSTIW
jgi:predicted KAP-like P-loop ATPase